MYSVETVLTNSATASRLLILDWKVDIQSYVCSQTAKSCNFVTLLKHRIQFLVVGGWIWRWVSSCFQNIAVIYNVQISLTNQIKTNLRSNDLPREGRPKIVWTRWFKSLSVLLDFMISNIILRIQQRYNYWLRVLLSIIVLSCLSDLFSLVTC
jgi:hypothetical protein